MKEKLMLFALLLDEIGLTAIYIITRFSFRYFLILISILIIKDIFIVTKVWHILDKKSLLGMESLINRVGLVVEDINPTGQIKIGTEFWKAESDECIRKEEKVIVKSIEGLFLKVEKYRGERNERECMVKTR
ncbi:MAG: NfeD family protein [Methanomicrobia archaeon]|nr:NfeD family protein [Methanomicrobia archaeon]